MRAEQNNAPPKLTTYEPLASTRNHLEALTGLRIVAALVVYFSHLAVPTDFPNWLQRARGRSSADRHGGGRVRDGTE